MFERFTDRARKVLLEAQTESVETGISFIGTEHLLIGMLREGTGVAAVVLADHGVSLEAVREKVAPELAQYRPVQEVDTAAALATIGIDVDAVRNAVEAAFGQGALADPKSQPPFTAGARETLELALRASLRWRHRYVGTEHLLEGLIGEGGGLAVSVLRDLGVDLDGLRDAAKRSAAPEAWRADHAWDAYLALRSQVWHLPAGPLRDELQANMDGFAAAAEEQLAIRAASDRLAQRLEEINSAIQASLP